MKKTIAKLCIWILGKLGYETNYNPRNTITISVDTTEAVKQIKRITFELDKLKSQLK